MEDTKAPDSVLAMHGEGRGGGVGRGGQGADRCKCNTSRRFVLEVWKGRLCAPSQAVEKFLSHTEGFWEFRALRLWSVLLFPLDMDI